MRHDRIQQDLDQASRLKEEADAAVAAYEQELADARAKANVIGQEARDGAKASAEAERKKVEASLDKKLGDAEAHIASIKAAAMKEVGTIAEDTAGAIVQELVGGKVDKGDDRGRRQGRQVTGSAPWTQHSGRLSLSSFSSASSST